MGGCLSRNNDKPKLVLCYGDSLTAGTSPPGHSMFPYGPALLEALHKLPGLSNTTVEYRGLPGWTCQHMLRAKDEEKHGLLDFIRIYKDPVPSVVIILAGTNDLAYIGEANPVVDCIAELHKLCWAAGVKNTVAVGIPPSAYQENHMDAADLCCEVNEALKSFCDSHPRASYVPFPFSFKRDDKWAKDGLHLSDKGYWQLGTQLAPSVAQVLK